MKLYLRMHVKALSLQRFGSEEALLKEKKQREEKRYEREVIRTKDTLKESNSELWSSFNDTIPVSTTRSSSSSSSARIEEAAAAATITTSIESCMSDRNHNNSRFKKRIVQYDNIYDDSPSTAQVMKNKNPGGGGRKKVALGDLLDIIRGPYIPVEK